MLCLRIFIRLGMRYERRQVCSSVMGFLTVTASTSGRPDISNSSLLLLRVRVVSSVYPSPIIISLTFSEKEVSGRSFPNVWVTSCLFFP